MEKTEVILVTGMSGAGKTEAMKVFENLGYQCLDNYPSALLKEFGDLLKNTNDYQKVAMAISLGDSLNAIRILSNMEWIDLSITFLDCADSTLLTRYKFTRRTHPLIIRNMASSLVEAIELERKQAEPIAKLADITIDTTLLKTKQLQEKLEAYFHKSKQSSFRISFVSFGYKYGIPSDADLLLDVRFLPNPFYVESLRDLTGNDQAVYDYVMEQPETQEFVQRTITYYDYLIREYKKEGKMSVIIGVGCTGGQHRSVTLTNYLADYYGQYYQTYKWHRDADR